MIKTIELPKDARNIKFKYFSSEQYNGIATHITYTSNLLTTEDCVHVCYGQWKQVEHTEVINGKIKLKEFE